MESGLLLDETIPVWHQNELQMDPVVVVGARQASVREPSQPTDMDNKDVIMTRMSRLSYDRNWCPE